MIHDIIRLEPEPVQGHSLKDGKERKTTRDQDLQLAKLAMQDSDQIVKAPTTRVDLSVPTVQC